MIHAFDDDKSKVNLGNIENLPYSNETLINNIKKVKEKTEYTTLVSGSDNFTVARSTLLQYSDLQITCIANDYGNYAIASQTVSISRFLTLFNTQNTEVIFYIGNGVFRSNLRVTYSNNTFTFHNDMAETLDHVVNPTYHISAR